MSKLSNLRTTILSKVIAFNWYKFDHICWWKSILYNGLWLGFEGLKKIPILIYNDVDILSLGKMEIEGDMHFGMIKIGIWKPKAHCKTRWINNSKVIFHGDIIIRGGTTLENEGVIEFGKYIMVGESVKIMCQKRIVIEDYASIGFESTIMDTDFHYMLDTEKMTVSDCKKEVYISKGTWISSYCKIMKGTQLPENSIVAGSSMVNKDFSQLPANTVFVGTPAKPAKIGYRRIFNKQEEDKLHEYFRKHPTSDFHVNISDVELYCCTNKFL